MLEIRKGNPWIFWPSSICDTFPLDPANKKLNGKFSFTLDIDFTLLDDTECKKTIFSLLKTRKSKGSKTSRGIFNTSILRFFMKINEITLRQQILSQKLTDTDY